MEDCVILYDDERTKCGCNSVTNILPSPGASPALANGIEKLMAWVKENPVTAAAIGGGLWFLFFSGDNKKRQK